MFDPDVDYLTTQSRALLRAIQEEVAAADAGHVEENGRSLRLAEHLAAEGGVRRHDILAARELLLATSAWFQGNEEVADRFAARMHRFDPSSKELLCHLMLLETGWDLGWLPLQEHQKLLEYARAVGRPDIELRAGKITPLVVHPPWPKRCHP
ncbi:hypothetical protein ACIA5G_39930 [Amycolatopsis sp. NPDC051758]|uniref:hypothetical protein n=1 Tax=Amycolatopsis sp. NPDC051758 TaxID=3363935 RepID=UPI0037B4547B